MFKKKTQTKTSGLFSDLSVYFSFNLTQYLRNNFKTSWGMCSHKVLNCSLKKYFPALYFMSKENR